jgi:hypothetical protein
MDNSPFVDSLNFSNDFPAMALCFELTIHICAWSKKFAQHFTEIAECTLTTMYYITVQCPKSLVAIEFETGYVSLSFCQYPAFLLCSESILF